MKLREALKLYHGLAKVKAIPNTKIAYAIVKNEKILKPLITDLSPKPTEEMKAYWADLGKCETTVAKEVCNKKNTKVLKKITKLQDDWEKELDDKDVTPMLHKVEAKEFPDNLTAAQIEILDCLV